MLLENGDVKELTEAARRALTQAIDDTANQGRRMLAFAQKVSLALRLPEQWFSTLQAAARSWRQAHKVSALDASSMLWSSNSTCTALSCN